MIDLTYSDAAQMITAVTSVITLIYAIHIGKRVNDVHLSLNSRLDAFLASTRAEGVAEGREAERNK